MKSTGIVRRVDELGRIVLPIELRQIMGIAVKDGLEIFTSEGNIILRKYEPACIFCGEASGTVRFRGKNICPACLKALSALRERGSKAADG